MAEYWEGLPWLLNGFRQHSMIYLALVRCLGHGISFSVLNNFLFGTNNFLFGTKVLSPSFFK